MSSCEAISLPSFLPLSLPPSFPSSLSYVLLVNIIKRNTQSKNTWITHPQKDCLGIPDSSWFHDWWSPSWTTEPHSLQCPRQWVGVNRRLLTHSGVSRNVGWWRAGGRGVFFLFFFDILCPNVTGNWMTSRAPRSWKTQCLLHVDRKQQSRAVWVESPRCSS